MSEIDPEEELERLNEHYAFLQSEGASPETLKEISDKYYSILEEVRSDDLQYEIEWAAILIENEVVQPNIFNTYEWVNTCVEQIDLPLETQTHLCDTYPPNKDWKYPLFKDDEYLFDDHWKGLDTLRCYKEYIDQNYDEAELYHYKENGVLFNPLEDFLYNIRSGCIPRPELLLSVAKAFHLYFCRQGELTLEEVFFGSPTKLGVYAKRRSEHFKGIDYRIFEHSVRRNYDGSTLEELAEIFIRNGIIDELDGSLKYEDVDSFLRKYRRWRERRNIKRSVKKPRSHGRAEDAER